MASARQLPNSYNVSTYGDATRDYTSLASWESDTDIDLVSAAAGEVLDVYDDNSPYDDLTMFSGALTSADFFRVIRAAPGQEPKGLWTQGPCFSSDPGVTAGIIDFREEYSQCHDLRLEVNGSSYSYRYGVTSQGGYNKAVGIITKNINPGSTNAGIFWYQNKISGPCVAVNCIAFGFTGTDGAGFTAWSGGIDCYYYNCTSINNDKGFFQDGGAPVAKNCIADGNTTDYSGTWAKTTCLDSTDGVVFVDAANDDYHLDSSDSAAIDQGTDLSSDADYAFTDDVDLEAREAGAWDVGADEFISPSPSVTTNSASNITSTTATLSGALDSIGEETSVSVYFEYGLDNNVENITPSGSLLEPTTFTYNLSGLSLFDKYYFRAAVKWDGNYSYGDILSFNTEIRPFAGIVTKNENPVENAVVKIHNSTQDAYVGETLTDLDGFFYLDASTQHTSGDVYHASVEYEDENKHQTYSYPFLNPEE